MIEVRVAHTAELDQAELAAARALLYRVFADMAEEDWEHSLGGVHALVRRSGGSSGSRSGRGSRSRGGSRGGPGDEVSAVGEVSAAAAVSEVGEVVAHAAVVQRRLVYRGRALRAGYVEGVGVEARLRGQGYGAAVMAALERVIRRAYDVGALAATDEAMGFYAARGWQRWQGRASALTPSGVVRTPDAEDCLFVLPVASGPVPELDLTAELTCDWRDGDVW